MDKTLGIVTVVGGLVVGGAYLLWRNAGTVGQTLESMAAQMKTSGDQPPLASFEDFISAVWRMARGNHDAIA